MGAAVGHKERRELFFVNNVDERLRSRMNVPFLIDVPGERQNPLYVEIYFQRRKTRPLWTQGSPVAWWNACQHLQQSGVRVSCRAYRILTGLHAEARSIRGEILLMFSNQK